MENVWNAFEFLRRACLLGSLSRQVGSQTEEVVGCCRSKTSMDARQPHGFWGKCLYSTSFNFLTCKEYKGPWTPGPERRGFMPWCSFRGSAQWCLSRARETGFLTTQKHILFLTYFL